MSNELKQLIESARHRTMTPEERKAQRISFAYGNLAIDKPGITREAVKAAAQALLERR